MAESVIENPRSFSGNALFEIQLAQRVNNAYVLCYNDLAIRYSKPITLVSVKTTEGPAVDLTSYFTLTSTDTDLIAYAFSSDVSRYLGKTLTLEVHFG